MSAAVLTLDELNVAPDIEEIVTTYLEIRLRQVLAPGKPMEDPPPVHVVTELWNGFQDGWENADDADLSAVTPVVQITRVGGGLVGKPVLHAARVDVDVYHATKAAASLLAHQIQALFAVHLIRGVVIAGGQITDVDEETGPSYRPSFGEARSYGLTNVLHYKKKGQA